MGVRGLHGYIESKGFLRIKQFRQSKLIIDGSSLYHQLYFGSELDRTHGGDYNGFEITVTKFFKNLSVCNIEAYVVLDGGDDVRGNKFDTLKKRYQKKIKRADDLSKGNSGEILPILIKNVFKQVLHKLRIQFIQCLGEADWEIAALANEWNCPVLSADSDFYIFNNQGGFLPITHFQWRNVSHESADKYFIPAKSFGIRNLCAAFNNMNVELLPLFATILGNDYSNPDKHSFPSFSRFSTRYGRQGEIDGLLTWLSRFPGLDEALAALVSLIGKNKQLDDLTTSIYQEMEVYRLQPSSVARFFTRGEPQTKPPYSLLNLPDWTLKPLAEGRLATTIIAVLTKQKVMLKIQVEDFGQSSSNNTSQVIRQVMYGMLLRITWQNVSKCSTSTAETQPDYVEEYNRQETTLSSSRVPAVLPRCVETHLPLDSLWEAPQHLRLQVMLEALDMSMVTNLDHVPEGLQLAIHVTCFWLKHAKPKPKAEIFWALLACLVYGHLCREQQTEKEIGPVDVKFKRLLSRKDTKPVDLKLAHAYSQWQCCLKDAFDLNQLLNHPLPEPELAWLYWGSLVHGVAHELKRGESPESFLAGDPAAIRLYQNLQAAVEYELDDKFTRRMRSQPTEHQESMDELSKGFEHLMDEDEGRNEDQSMKDETRRNSKELGNPNLKNERVSWQ